MESSYRAMVKRLSDLRSEFTSSWDPHLRELYEQFAPRRARFDRRDFNRGTKANGAVINNKPLLAARTFAAGFMAAVTSPLSEWFRLTTPDPDLNDYGPVKLYLHRNQERLRWAFQMGTYYRGLADGIYPDLGIAGFTCGLMEEHPERLITLNVLPVGEYYLAADEDGEIDTIYRETPMTVRQLVYRFGLRRDARGRPMRYAPIDFSKMSSTVKSLWERNQLNAVIDVVNVIQPNADFLPGRLGPEGQAWASWWFEAKAENEEKFLRKSGYDDFPALCPRWAPRSGEAYSSRSPAMEALGDAKQLQHHERRLANLIDKSANPPMVADESMQGRKLSLVPGDVVYAPRGQGEAFKPAFEVQAQAILSLLQHIERTEDRIDAGMFADLFARVLRDERNQRATAREIEEMSREVASLLGPNIERLNGELYSPSIDRGWSILERRGLLVDAPPELEGMEVKAEFISVMHQAQKGVGLQPLRVFVGEVAALASIRPDALDKLDADEIVDRIADATGAPPTCILSDDEVAKVRAARAKRQQAQEQLEAGLAMADGAKALGSTPAPDTSNLLGQVVSNLTPGGAVSAANAPLGPIASSGFPQAGARA